MTDDLSRYAVVEIMGRRTRAGRISDATIGGATLLRIEHPTRPDHTGEEPLTELYGPTAIFAIRPCSIDEATAVAGWAWAGPPERRALDPAFEDLVDEDDDRCDCDDDNCPECENRHAADQSHHDEEDPF